MLLSTVESQNFCVFECKYWRSKSILPYCKKSRRKIQKGGKTPKSPISQLERDSKKNSVTKNISSNGRFKTDISVEKSGILASTLIIEMYMLSWKMYVWKIVSWLILSVLSKLIVWDILNFVCNILVYYVCKIYSCKKLCK